MVIPTIHFFSTCLYLIGWKMLVSRPAEIPKQIIKFYALQNCPVTSIQLIVLFVKLISLLLSFIYDLNKIVPRRELWESINHLGWSIEGPWALVGNFNNVHHANVKANDNKVTIYEMRDFMKCCNVVLLMLWRKYNFMGLSLLGLIHMCWTS